jgi:hypothetical protein
MFNTDVATGKSAAAGHSSTGLGSAFTKSETPPPEEQAQCYLWDVLETCTGSQKQILRNGTAVVENFILVGQKESNGSVVFFNGTHGGESGTASSPPSSANTIVSAASALTTSGSIGTVFLSVALFVALQTALF